MSIWEFLARSYLGALALMQTYWPALLIVAVLLIVVGWLASDREPSAEPEAVSLLSQDEQDALSGWYVRHADAQADVAYARGELLAESEEDA